MRLIVETRYFALPPKQTTRCIPFVNVFIKLISSKLRENVERFWMEFDCMKFFRSRIQYYLCLEFSRVVKRFYNVWLVIPLSDIYLKTVTVLKDLAWQ